MTRSELAFRARARFATILMQSFLRNRSFKDLKDIPKATRHAVSTLRAGIINDSTFPGLKELAELLPNATIWYRNHLRHQAGTPPDQWEYISQTTLYPQQPKEDKKLDEAQMQKLIADRDAAREKYLASKAAWRDDDKATEQEARQAFRCLAVYAIQIDFMADLRQTTGVEIEMWHLPILLELELSQQNWWLIKSKYEEIHHFPNASRSSRWHTVCSYADTIIFSIFEDFHKKRSYRHCLELALHLESYRMFNEYWQNPKTRGLVDEAFALRDSASQKECSEFEWNVKMIFNGQTQLQEALTKLSELVQENPKTLSFNTGRPYDKDPDAGRSEEVKRIFAHSYCIGSKLPRRFATDNSYVRALWQDNKAFAQHLCEQATQLGFPIALQTGPRPGSS